CFFFSSRRRHTRWPRDWSSDVCSPILAQAISTVINLSANSSEEPDARLRFGNINGWAAHKPKPLPFAIGYRAPWNRQSRMEESRSEERRVGKEGKTRGCAEHEKKEEEE